MQDHIQHLLTDPIMAKLISHCGPCTLKPRRLPPFQSLTHAIIHQQLSGNAAGTILKRFKGLYGHGKFPHTKQVVDTPHDQLRGAGLSNAKAKYIHELAQRAQDGKLPTLKQCDKMTDAELIEMLTEINGIGRWTTEMLLIFNLGRPDVLATWARVGSPVKKVLSRVVRIGCSLTAGCSPRFVVSVAVAC